MFNCVTLVCVVSFVLIAVSGIEKCPRFHIKSVKRKTIVQAHESVEKLGAKYLGVVDADGFHDCYDACCKKDTCDMVNMKREYTQFKTEKQAKCYMFNCGMPSKCLYHSELDSKVANYAVLEFESRDQVSSNTWDLNDSENAKNVSSKPKWMHPNEHKWPHKWPLDNDKKKENDWFIKSTTATPSYDFDSLEESTTNQEPHIWSTKEKKTLPVTASTTTKEWPTRKEETKNGYDGSKYSFDRDHDATDGRQDNAKETATEESFPRRVFPDNNPDYPELPKNHHNIPRSTNPPTTEKETDKPTTIKERTMKVFTTKVPTKPGKSDFNSVVIKRFSIQENKAVIPLAVGLVLSLLLLMAVVFRLKTSRRRRTKAFLTDDADYLINGMYL